MPGISTRSAVEAPDAGLGFACAAHDLVGSCFWAVLRSFKGLEAAAIGTSDIRDELSPRIRAHPTLPRRRPTAPSHLRQPGGGRKRRDRQRLARSIRQPDAARRGGHTKLEAAICEVLPGVAYQQTSRCGRPRSIDKPDGSVASLRRAFSNTQRLVKSVASAESVVPSGYTPPRGHFIKLRPRLRGHVRPSRKSGSAE